MPLLKLKQTNVYINVVQVTACVFFSLCEMTFIYLKERL